MNKRQKILIVDDAKFNRDILKEFLGETYDYLEAENGNQAVQIMEENPGMAHKIVLNNRNQGNLTGILDVISFDENTIVLDTDMGLLTIKGKDLHVNRLSLEKGEVDLSGNIDSIAYSDVHAEQKQGENLFARLFR